MPMIIFFYLDFNFVNVVVKPLHQVDEELVSILLIVTAEVLLELTDGFFEVGRSYGLILAAPECGHDLGKLDGNLTPSLRLLIDVNGVCLVDEEFREDSEVGKALEDAVHIAGVP